MKGKYVALRRTGKSDRNC